MITVIARSPGYLDDEAIPFIYYLRTNDLLPYVRFYGYKIYSEFSSG